MVYGPGTPTVMDNHSHTPPVLYVGAGLFAVIVHGAIMLYENKPISPRKAAASCILTGCVGGVSALLATEYGRFSPAIVLAIMLGVGGVGGWSIIQILTVAGKRWVRRRAEALAGEPEPEPTQEGKEP